MNPKVIEIDRKCIGSGHPVYIIAELSANHNQDFDTAIKLIRAAKTAGADAVKTQTFTPDTITLDSNRPEFKISGGTLWDGKTLYELYQEAYMPWEWHAELKKEANKLGMTYFSSPFDSTAVDFLEKLEVPAYKVASPEVIDLPLLERIAQTQKPIIVSTGMATIEEIQDAIEILSKGGNLQIALLKCTSAYPAPFDSMNLRTLPNMSTKFQLPVGLSDHTLGIEVPIAAVALGAVIIEKHFTLSRAIETPDAGFSLEPHEFKEMTQAIKNVFRALGKIQYDSDESEKETQKHRRSLYITENMSAGDTFTKKNVRSIRPGYGLLPKYLNDVLGRRAKRDIKKGTPLSWDLIE